MSEPVNTVKQTVSECLTKVMSAILYNEDLGQEIGASLADSLDDMNVLIDPELLEAINRRQKADRAERVMESLLVDKMEADFLGNELPVTFDTQGREVEMDYIAREGYVTYTRTVSPWKKTHHVAEDR